MTVVVAGQCTGVSAVIKSISVLYLDALLFVSALRKSIEIQTPADRTRYSRFVASLCVFEQLSRKSGTLIHVAAGACGISAHDSHHAMIFIHSVDVQETYINGSTIIF